MKILQLPLARSMWYFIVRHYPVFACKLMYKKAVGGGKSLNLSDPKDLNEKINYLKFHADMNVWASLADKYAVREYVKGKGLEDILVPLYGKWDTSDGLLRDWDALPQKFILKTNNGCGTVLPIKDKSGVDLDGLKKRLDKWLTKKDIGIGTVELHYNLIKPCIIAEELLEDPSVKSFSRSLVDYKIWCFEGKTFCCMAAYDREIGGSHHIFDLYDLNWNEHTELMSDKTPRHLIPRPKNWGRMKEIAGILSAGHPQMRVDLYDIDGKIYFGELTMTSQGGYMDYFTDGFLLEMGSQFEVR